MYITAHRVFSRRTNQQGINAFLHWHDTQDDCVDWDSPDLLAIVTEQTSGRPISENITVIPGSNEVQSHLDVVAPDGTATDTIRAALAQGLEKLTNTGLTCMKFGKVIVAFGCQIGLRGAEHAEFKQLAAAVERVLVEPPKPRAQGAPIRIQVSAENDELIYRLDDKEIARISGANGHPHARVAVRAAPDTLDAYEEIHGDISPEFAQFITGLTPEQLLALGGCEFVDAKTDKLLRRWPLPRD